ncbi:MAG: HAD-IIB family hydrolase [archaeon]|nr:HAD-IIB family hydrolase [archaeon]
MEQIEQFKQISSEQAKKIKVVFCDIDDTISSDGKILPEAYNALWRLNHAGIDVVPITGRCAGWVDHIARMWPVKGVVGENGAFYSYMNDKKQPYQLIKRNFLESENISESKKKFIQIKSEIFKKYPSIKVASDQPYREFDLAIDFCEDVPPLPMNDVLEIVKIFEKYGAKTKISSIHVNGWFGDYDKLTMTKIFIKEQLGFNLESNPDWALFIGDSPNDQPMFEFFPISVGVRNIKNFENILLNFPKYITKNESGIGFAEMTDILLEKLHENE